MAAPPSPEALARLPDAELERLPTAVLDRAAFGFASGDVIELPVHQIHIRYADDLENAQHEVRTEAQARRYLEVAKKKPVEVYLRGGEFDLDDGHHRYVSAVMLKQSTLRARVEIKDNPITALRRQFPQARDCGCSSASESTDAEREGARDDEERFVFGWDYGTYDVKGNRHVLEQLARRYPYSGPALRGGSATPKPPVSWVKDRAHLLNYWRQVGVPRHRIDAYEAEVAGALDVSTLAAAVAQRTKGLLRERAEKLHSFGEVVTLDLPPMHRIGQIVQDGYGGDVTLERSASDVAEDTSGLTVRNEVLDYHSGETYGRVLAFVDGIYAGRIDWGEYHGETTIKMIEVEPPFQRRGVATAMYRRLRDEAPEGPILWGMMTPEGRALYRQLKARRELREEARRATTTRFYHGSWDDLPVGTVLRGREGTERLPVERLLDHMRPSSMVSPIGAVYMVQTIVGMEQAGGGATGDFVYEVEPLGHVSGPFHGGWHAEIAGLYLDHYRDRTDLAKYVPFVKMADAYWRGLPCRGDMCAGAWEWITPEARILRKVARDRSE